ncbi:MAG: ABC transporter ATP-binding protein [Pseudomonadota bacterium]
MALLDIKNLTIEYPDRHGTFTAVKDVSLSVERGEILGIVGESGAGKSTIGNAVMGLLQAPGRIGGGEVYLDGERLDTKSYSEMRPLRGKRIGMIFQDPMTSLNPLETVESQLVETIELHLKLGDKSSKARAVELLDQVGIANAAERIKQYPHEFSGGMRQRVVIALALCAEPDLIIADEPTTALDVSIQAQILELIKSLCRDRQVGMILVTHDMGVIAETADRVAVMYRGDLVEVGTTAQITQAPTHDYTKVLISAVPPSNHRVERFTRVDYQGDGESRVKDLDLETHWLGEGNRRTAESGPILSIKDLNKVFKSRTGFLAAIGASTHAVKDVSFDVQSGETFGIVGESGSGKSTIARLITGIHRATSGSMVYDGQDLMKPARGREAMLHRRQIQMIFQDPYSSLNSRMKVGQIVAEPIFVNGLAGSRGEALEIAKDLLELVELSPDAARRYPHAFSGGQRQRISIARALASRPRFLICDEPTSALDVSIQAQILNLLKDLQARLDLTLLFISHDLPVMRQMCDRIAVMKLGEVVELAEAEAIFEAPQHNYTQQLINLMPKFEKIEAA